MADLFPRLQRQHLTDLLQHMRVVLVVGPRRSGKTTLVKSHIGDVACTEGSRSYLTLDDPSTLSTARSDPEGFVESLDPFVTIDEVQNAIDLILPIKQSVDADERPGRFLLTGSANVLLLPRLADSLAGRMATTTLLPLAQAEIEEGLDCNLIDDIFDPGFDPRVAAIGEPKADTLQRIAVGGYPEALQRSSKPSALSQWFSSYTDSILRRDVRDIVTVEKIFDMDRLLRLLASRNTGLINYADLSRSLGLSQTTVKRYCNLLELVYMVRRVPAWHRNIGLRTVKAPKIYFNDTGLWSHLQEIGVDDLERDGSLTGPAFENFVGMELIKLADSSKARVNLYHWRSQQGQEVDIVLERTDGGLIAIEAKASSSITKSDIKGIIRLSEGLKDSFLRGIVFYTGKNVLPLEEDIWAMPVTALWRGMAKK